MKRARKLLALLLLLVFAVAAIPTMAFAADPDADGNLTVTIPYTTAAVSYTHLTLPTSQQV